MLGTSMTARNSSSRWISISQLALAPAAHPGGLEPWPANHGLYRPRDGAPHSTLRASRLATRWREAACAWALILILIGAMPRPVAGNSARTLRLLRRHPPGRVIFQFESGAGS